MSCGFSIMFSSDVVKTDDLLKAIRALSDYDEIMISKDLDSGCIYLSGIDSKNGSDNEKN